MTGKNLKYTDKNLDGDIFRTSKAVKRKERDICMKLFFSNVMSDDHVVLIYNINEKNY